jgi:hypothetical protein
MGRDSPRAALDIHLLDSRERIVFQGIVMPDVGAFKHELPLPTVFSPGLYFSRAGRQSPLIRKFLVE